jgi:hypothetical protein
MIGLSFISRYISWKFNLLIKKHAIAIIRKNFKGDSDEEL